MLLVPSLITILSLLFYLVLTLNVSRARVKYKVPAPRITGDESFERILRVQQNTSEQLLIFLPALWIFALLVNVGWAAVLGTVWLLGRLAYTWGYYRSAKQRAVGFAIGAFSSLFLLIGSLIGVLVGLVQ